MGSKIFSNNKNIERVVQIVSLLHSKRQRHYPEYELTDTHTLLAQFCQDSFTQQFMSSEYSDLEQYLEHLFKYCQYRYKQLEQGYEDTEWCFGCIEEALDQDSIYFHILLDNGYPDYWIVQLKELISALLIQFMRIETFNECFIKTVNHLQLIKKHLF